MKYKKGDKLKILQRMEVAYSRKWYQFWVAPKICTSIGLGCALYDVLTEYKKEEYDLDLYLDILKSIRSEYDAAVVELNMKILPKWQTLLLDEPASKTKGLIILQRVISKFKQS